MMSEQLPSDVKLFVRQILQIVPERSLRWPEPDHLRLAQHQHFIFARCFDTTSPRFLGPSRYRYSVLKSLVTRIESAIRDPEEDEISEELMDCFTELMMEGVPSEMDAARQRSCVIYATSADGHESDISVLESPSIISGSGTTGLRTWEAALHLGAYLLSSAKARDFIRERQIIELGAGTGFLSILCAKSLMASNVVSTDGSEEVVEALKTNIEANNVQDSVSAGVLKWGWHLDDTVVGPSMTKSQAVTIIGADVTYDQSVIPSLVSSIRHMFEAWPTADVLISATLRNEETFAAFEHACDMNSFLVSTLQFPVQPATMQSHLFHAATTPIKILHIRAPMKIRDPFKLD